MKGRRSTLVFPRTKFYRRSENIEGIKEMLTGFNIREIPSLRFTEYVLMFKPFVTEKNIPKCNKFIDNYVRENHMTHTAAGLPPCELLLSACSLSAKRVFLFEVLLLRTAILTAFFVPTSTKTLFALVTQV